MKIRVARSVKRLVILRCYGCGKDVQEFDAEWIGKGSDADPYKPFCDDCSKKQ